MEREPVTSVKLYFWDSWLPLCVFYPCVRGYCFYHKGILSPPSWSYQSLAELCGLGKVIHTTGGSRHGYTSHPPLCCFLCLFNFWRWRRPSFFGFIVFFFFLSVACSFFHTSEETRGWGQRSTSQSRASNDIPLVYCNSCDLDQVRQT